MEMVKEFTNREIVERLNGLAAVLDSEQRYDAKLVFSITKNINAFQEAYKPYEQTLNRIRGTHDEETENEEMDREIKELQSEKVEVDLRVVPFSSLEQYKFTIQEMLALSDMILEQEDTAE